MSLIEHLMTPRGEELLALVEPYDSSTVLTLTATLRAQGWEPELIAAALTQAQFRWKAGEKFGPFAARMLFTRDGLEQATRLPVAVHHARRYLNAGITHIVDLTAGIGADAMAFGALGLRVTACDIDAETATIAAHNVRPFPEVQVINADSLTLDFETHGIDAIYADPARRTAGRRVFDPAAHLPPLPTVWDLAQRVPALGVKVGPGIGHEHIPAGTEAQWVSVGGDVVEASVWFGPLSHTQGRTALLMDHAGQAAHTFRRLDDEREGADRGTASGPDVPVIATPSDIGSVVYEPDGAIIRAGLVRDLAARLDASLLDPSIAYLTGDSAVAPSADGVRLARAYRVEDVLPYNVKNLRSYLKERKVGSVEIKKRGIDITPEKLRPQLGLRGPHSCTVILTRVGSARVAIIAQPI
ncbi:class I SAM-dependent methyltransferase [Jonesia quinghaiensis]|uniref:class I SAM-dependent methyltransferase n=1 Tax=Jonesia quinghaiensis TaxID=262806 RepID=UPI000413E58A|nr:class I SAM-dependent methyltransferase [Jonesia quinghaiensis]